MPTITTDIDFDLDAIDDYDLINELESRGYDVHENGYDVLDLIDRIEDKGYTVYGKGHKPNITRAFVEELYTTYQTMSPEFFQKELKRFFREQLDRNIY
jgi:hypothetical protein